MDPTRLGVPSPAMVFFGRPRGGQRVCYLVCQACNVDATLTSGPVYDLPMRATDGELEVLLDGHSDQVRTTTLRLRELMHQSAPEARESVDLPDHLLAYGWTDRMRDLIVAIAPHSAHVNLQLADGATLPDTDGVVESTGKRIRHVKCRTVSDADRPNLRALIEAQIATRPAPLRER